MNRIYTDTYSRGGEKKKEEIKKKAALIVIKEKKDTFCSSLFEVEKFLCDVKRLCNIIKLHGILK